MELSDTLNAIHIGHKQSIDLLRSYLLHIDGSIKKLQQEHETIIEKLEAARLGNSNIGPFTPSEHVKVSPELVDRVVEAIKFIHGRTSEYPNLTYRMLFVYLVALFDAFLSDIFSAVARTRPHVLRSSKKQISYDRLLEFSSFDALVDFIVSRELNELSYKSIRDQTDYYRDRFGVALEESGVAVAELIELRAARNLLVHNNGVVNNIYMELVPDTTYRLGDELRVDACYFEKSLESLETVADFIPRKLIEKHGRKPTMSGNTSISAG